MSTAVAEAFGEYLSRIELNPSRRGVASARYNAVKAVIEGAIPGSSVRQIGSFQRNTKVRPLNMSDGLDVDAIVVFGEVHHYATDGRGRTPLDAQERVYRALTSNEIYRVMRPQKDAPTVMLEYADRDGFTIELVPAYVDLTGRYPRPAGPPCYIIAGPNGRWVPADYDYDAAVVSGLNQSPGVGRALVPVVKLAKMFFRSMEIDWKSFHIEVLLATTLPDVLRAWTASGQPWGIPEAFSAAIYLVAENMDSARVLPGSWSPPVTLGIETSILDQVQRYVANRAEAARRLLSLPDAAALAAWREFFGETFPAPNGGWR